MTVHVTTAALTAPMTVAEFVEWAADQPGRFELIDGEVVPMPSEGGRHNMAKFRLARLLEDAVVTAGLHCTVFTDGMTVQIEPKRGREPDALVTAGPVADWDARIAVDPMIVVEVVSPSSEKDDTGEKLLDYFSVPSIQHYLIVRTKEQTVVHHRRGADGTIITRLVRSGAIELDPPGISFQVEPVFATGPGSTPAKA